MAIRSARRTRIIAVPATAAILTVTLAGGCGGKSATMTPDAAVNTGPAVATGPAAVAGSPAAVAGSPAAAPTATGGDSEYNGACPTEGNARPFAKTRFALHAGLALGAFHRYIYKPLRAGGFKEGAEKRKRTFLKAAIAGAFALHELKVAKGFAAANPTLCKAVEGVSRKFQSLTDKLKGGTAGEHDLDASKTSMDGLQKDASKTGFNFKEQNVTIPGAS
ncbi:hypothetical protein AB0M95_30055 [Sphaerisporangium sp. NPDC051017]|uniref:hypothetical protein n=1 Tax=Sphaerisporangium sp. NPDC051017 TaxID=3154636 RepID=UPI00342B2FB4